VIGGNTSTKRSEILARARFSQLFGPHISHSRGTPNADTTVPALLAFGSFHFVIRLLSLFTSHLSPSAVRGAPVVINLTVRLASISF
jgi:hypothetical protein